MNYKKWSENEKEFILNNHEVMDDKALASKLSEISGNLISVQMVRRQRKRLNINKGRGRPSKKNKAVSYNMENNI